MNRHHALSIPAIQTPYATSTAVPQIRASRTSNRPRPGKDLKRNTITDDTQPERPMRVIMDHIPSDTGPPFPQHAPHDRTKFELPDQQDRFPDNFF